MGTAIRDLVRRWRLELMLVASAGGTALAFPPVNWWWLLLLAPGGLVWVVRQGEKRKAGWIAFGWGCVMATIQSWYILPTLALEASAEWSAGLAWTLLLVWYSTWCGLFGWIIARLKGQGVVWVVGVASAWTAVSWLRSLGEWGFPWGMLGSV